ALQLQHAALRDLVCHRSLPPVWHHLVIHSRPAEVPIRCVQMNEGGTQAPVWLPLKSKSLPAAEESKRLTGCATWQAFFGAPRTAFHFRSPSTRSCAEFFVCVLQPTQACMGSCAEG
ncbi:VWDE protein, partial [Ramphastos sulfuratus]|nr:VWDE protein [Ramphastos sulfuratus]